MTKAKIVVDAGGKFYGVEIMCKGCGYHHMVQTSDWCPPDMERSEHRWTAQWTFNGDFDKPVFGPSLLVTSNRWDKATEQKVPTRCHTFVGCHGAEPGQIIYLNDCTHALAGQVVDLPEIDE